MSQANPLPAELSAQLSALSPTQLAWLSGYCWAQSQGVSGAAAEPTILQAAAPAVSRRVLVLSASQTGNARSVAESLHAKLQAAGVEARLSSAGDFKSKTLPDEDIARRSPAPVQIHLRQKETRPQQTHLCRLRPWRLLLSQLLPSRQRL